MNKQTVNTTHYAVCASCWLRTRRTPSHALTLALRCACWFSVCVAAKPRAYSPQPAQRCVWWRGLLHCRHTVRDWRPRSVSLHRRGAPPCHTPSQSHSEACVRGACAYACVCAHATTPYTRSPHPPQPATLQAGTPGWRQPQEVVSPHPRRPKHVAQRCHAARGCVLRGARAWGAHLPTRRVHPKLGAHTRRPAHEVGSTYSLAAHSRGTRCACIDKRKARVRGVAAHAAPVTVTNLDDRGTLSPPNGAHSARTAATQLRLTTRKHAYCACANCRVCGGGVAACARAV